jgi:hypothetical protein
MPTSRRLIPHRRTASGRPHSNSLSERRSPIDLSGVAAQHAMHVHALTVTGVQERLGALWILVKSPAMDILNVRSFSSSF